MQIPCSIHAEPTQRPRRINANPRRTQAEPVESPCRTQAETVHNRCRFHAESMKIPCGTHAESTQTPRRIHAEPTQHPCRIHAKAMHNSCSSHADHTRIRVLFFSAFAPQLDDEHVSLKALELLLPSRLATCLAACLVRRLLRSGVATQIWRLRASHAQCLQPSRSLLLPQLAHEGGDECLRPSMAKLF